MHISDLHDYNPKESEAAKEFIALRRREKIKAEIEELINDEFDRFELFADSFISDIAAARAQRFLKRVLNGDDDAAIALLGDRHSGDRYRSMGHDKGKPWGHLIHGHLFETGGIALRRAIVEAHSELLRNERIADLESIVDGLSQQVRELEFELERQRRGTR